ncbi:hypothetical protein FGO68_gene10510 [Halteria grandinella]|uniref:Nudix hydrolase domain-containing protein n=1 Tax=Halteria grandinella TaxID=5974 RepID=A0A8J8NIV7_HALGN|nr:hypothetical protein FGO68_gene10510 [Halteria grandinella]
MVEGPIPHKDFDKSKRPKVGLGIMLLNEFDEVLVSQRFAEEGHPFHLRWQFPGGYLEFGETFEEAGVREVREECAVDIDPTKLRYVTTMNVRGVEFEYHNVGIFMATQVIKEQIKPVNTEPEKNSDWSWVKWEDFIKRDNLFHPFHYFIEQGFADLDKIKKQAGFI